MNLPFVLSVLLMLISGSFADHHPDHHHHKHEDDDDNDDDGPRFEYDKIVDLSHPLNNATLHWITDRSYELKIKNNGTTNNEGNEFWLQTEEIALSTHTATHLDAPCHFAKGRWSVADIPLKNLIDRPLAVVDVSQQCLVNRDYEASVDDVEEWEKLNGKIPEGAVLMIKTGWSRFWPKKLEYFGTEGSDPKQIHFPGVHPDLAKWIIDNRHIVGLAIDSPSVDNGVTKNYLTHVVLAEKNIYNLENIARSVHELPMTGYRITTLPVKLTGASGVPVTVIAYPSSSNSINGKRWIMPIGVLILTVLFLWNRF